MRVLNLVLAVIEQVDFPDDDLEKQTSKYLERLEVELESVGFSPSSELSDIAEDLESALTEFYAKSDIDEDNGEEDLDKDEDTLPTPKEEVE